jgi:hypothetical protein
LPNAPHWRSTLRAYYYHQASSYARNLLSQQVATV